MRSEKSSSISTWVVSLLGLWLVVVFAAAYIGIFGAGSRYSMSVPLPLGLAFLIPILVFIFWYKLSPRFREYVFTRNPAHFILWNVERVGGVTFLVLMSQHLLPPTFALPAGLGDIAIGLTAPLIAWQFSKTKHYSRAFVIWNALGIADLFIAVTTGVLSSNAKFGFLPHGAVPTQLMGQLPLCLVPTFLVPLFIMLHLIALAQANKARQQAEVGDAILARRVA